jgi:hypothetical protein
MSKGGRKKGPKPDRKPKVRDVFVGQPFEGLAAEPELIALREFVPSATAKLSLKDSEKTVTLGTVLPMAAAAFVRSDGEMFVGVQVQTRSSDISRDLGRSLRWVLDAKPGDVLAAPDTTSAPAEGERLQDLLVPGAELDATLHTDFAWWLPEDADASGEVGLSLERSRYAGSFRAHGLLVPVWDLDPEAHAREWADGAKELGVRLESALKSLDAEPLNATERRSRDGLIGRQLTLR